MGRRLIGLSQYYMSAKRHPLPQEGENSCGYAYSTVRQYPQREREFRYAASDLGLHHEPVEKNWLHELVLLVHTISQRVARYL
jgi:hypothetical protein